MIVPDPKVLMGKPVVAGTRITIEHILEKLAAGRSVAQLVEARPRPSEQAIGVALAFAANVLRADVAYPGPDKTGEASTP